MNESTKVEQSGDTADTEAFDVFQRIGNLTRNLHDALKQLGYDKHIESSLGVLPDARTRLDFIARLTGDAAEKVLNTVDTAQAQQNLLLLEAGRIEQLLLGNSSADNKDAQLLKFVEDVRNSTRMTGAQLSDIMLAQDFHDLTGQTIRKVVELATLLENSLVRLLLDTTPREHWALIDTAGLQGPVANPDGRPDVVSSQEQVDDLLATLGF